MRSKKTALILATCLLGACATGRPDARARIYQDELDIERYSMIRMTFRNRKLLQSRVWTDITTSNVSGFTVKRVP